MTRILRSIYVAVAFMASACHQSLQIGAPGQNDAAVDAIQQDGEPERPWYDRNEAYIGEEVRVPVPEAMVLRRDLGEAHNTPISLVSGPDGELLVAQGNRLHVFEWTPDGVAQRSPPGGVRVARAGRVSLVPHRRIALSERNTYFGNAFSGAPDWSTTASLQDPVLPRFDLERFSAGTTSDGNSVVVASVSGALPPELATYALGPGNAIGVYRTFAPDGTGYQNVGASFHGSPHHVLATGTRALVARMSTEYSPSSPRVVIEEVEWAVGRPMRPLLSNFLAGGQPDFFQAAVGDDHVLVVYGRLPDAAGRGYVYSYFADVGTEPDWGPHALIEDIAPSEMATVAWDPSQRSFVVAVRPTPAAGTSNVATELHRMIFSGAAERFATVPLRNVSLTTWRGEVWGAGVNDEGELRVFAANSPTTSLSDAAQLVGPQALQGMVLHRGAPQLLWSDGTHQAAVSRLELTSGLAIESRALVPNGDADRPTGPPRFLRDGDNLFVASSVFDGGVLLRLDPNSDPSAEARQVFGPLRFAGGPPTGEALWPLHVRDNIVMWRALYRTGQFSGMTGLFDRSSALQLALRGITKDAVQCAGMSCVEDRPATQNPTLAIEVSDDLNLRVWTGNDAATFPLCVTSTRLPAASDLRDDRVWFQRDATTGDCLPQIMPFADSTVPYVCAPSLVPGETCGDLLAAAHSEAHTLLAETRVSLGAATKLELRLYEAQGTRLARTLNLPIAIDEQTGSGLMLMHASTRLLHVRGGLFLLAYSRTGATGAAETYVRTVYFPEAENRVP